MIVRRKLLVVAMSVVAVAGCRNDNFATAPVEGKVLCNGTPITSGVVYFQPLGEAGQVIAGKPAGGVVGADGRFLLSTYDEGDGAVIGRHRVSWQAEDENAGNRPGGGGCSREAFAEVEIPSGGTRDLVVDLTLPSR